MKKSENSEASRNDQGSSGTLVRDWSNSGNNISSRTTEGLAVYNKWTDPAATITRPVRASAPVKRKTISIKRRASIMLAGVVLGIMSTLTFMYSRQAVTTNMAQTPSPILHVSLGSGDPIAEPFVETESLIPLTLDQFNQRASSEEVIEYITHYTAPAIGEREYLFLSNSERMSVSDHGSHVQSVPQINLQAVENREGRFRTGTNQIEWQGSWQFNNPARNIETGSAYRDYLSSFSGSSHFGSLVTFENEKKNNLLQRLGSTENRTAPGRYNRD
jgi:hypothetical protein